MLSDDLVALRGVFARRVAMFDGQVFLDARQASAVLELLGHAIRTAEAQEQLIYASGRPLPAGVVDIEEARRRRAARVCMPEGGAA